MKIVDVQSQRFDPGTAATPLNGGDFGAEDALVVTGKVALLPYL